MRPDGRHAAVRGAGGVCVIGGQGAVVGVVEGKREEKAHAAEVGASESVRAVEVVWEAHPAQDKCIGVVDDDCLISGVGGTPERHCC